MATVTDYANRTSTAQDVTTTLTPASGDNYAFTIFGVSQPIQTAQTVEWSANGGTNFFDPQGNFNIGGGGSNSAQMSAGTGGVTDVPINLRLNNGSRFRYTNPATTGTYIRDSIGVIWAT